jgi:cytochrome c556
VTHKGSLRVSADWSGFAASCVTFLKLTSWAVSLPQLFLFYWNSSGYRLFAIDSQRGLMITRIVLSLAVAMTVGTIASANPEAIATRKAVMKGVGAETGVGAKMIKGETPFDLERAKKIFAAYEAAAVKVPTLYPDGSKTGGETSAAPRIWDDMAGFKERFVKFGADAGTAASAVTDLDSFKAAFGSVTRNCSGCHEVYRLKKS